MEIPPKASKQKKYGRHGWKKGHTLGPQNLRPEVNVYNAVCQQVRDQGSNSQNTTPDLEPWVIPDSATELKEKQLQDPDIAPIIKWQEEGKRPFGPMVAVTSPATHHYWLYWDNLCLLDGVLFRKFEKRDGSDTLLQLITPRTVQGDVLHHMHKGLLGGHLGKRRTTERVLQNYYWFDMRTDVDLYVMQCEQCQKVKEPTKCPRAPLGQLPVGGPLETFLDLFRSVI